MSVSQGKHATQTLYCQIPTQDLQVANKAYVDQGGGVTFARIVKSADQIVNNSTTLVNDTELLFNVNANKVYAWMLWFLFNSSLAADIKYLFTIPAGASILRANQNYDATLAKVTADATVADSFPCDGSDEYALIMGRAIVAGTAGTIQLQWAQQGAEVSDTKVLAGAYLIVWESAL